MIDYINHINMLLKFIQINKFIKHLYITYTEKKIKFLL